MTGIIDLDQLLKQMSPTLQSGEYVFCTVAGELSDYLYLDPIATFREREGLTLVLPKQSALDSDLDFEGVFRMITLAVHSSLDAVGLTAAVATKLKEKGISANVIAAYFHDHVFVQVDNAALALQALREFSD